MAITIIATPKAPNANTYCTLEEANTFWEMHLYADVWNGSSDEQKKAALVQATRILDSLNWKGYKTTLEQSVRWPRSGLCDPDGEYIDDDIIPANIKYANAEMAGELLAENRAADQGTQTYSSVSVGSISVVYDKQGTRHLIPRSVKDYIKWWLCATNTIPLVRT